MRVTVFGGSGPKPGSEAYGEAYRLGKLIGQAGYTVLTGGYIGTMEAASKGAYDHGGHVIGVTCEDIERWRAVGPNSYVMEQMRFPTLNERLMALVFNCDAAVALPGGLGTLAEIGMYWNHLAIEAIPPRPLVLVGEGWRDTVQTFLDQLGEYVPDRHKGMIQFAATVEEAFEIVQTALNRLSQAA
jgi:uncharacterized protein (TIGR00730 family)